MNPLSPGSVPAPRVRRLEVPDKLAVLVQRVVARKVPKAHAVPRQLDSVDQRLMALQLENAHLRAELARLRGSTARPDDNA